jgi:hypothetical protein
MRNPARSLTWVPPTEKTDKVDDQQADCGGASCPNPRRRPGRHAANRRLGHHSWRLPDVLSTETAFVSDDGFPSRARCLCCSRLVDRRRRLADTPAAYRSGIACCRPARMDAHQHRRLNRAANSKTWHAIRNTATRPKRAGAALLVLDPLIASRQRPARACDPHPVAHRRTCTLHGGPPSPPATDGHTPLTTTQSSHAQAPARCRAPLIRDGSAPLDG